MNYELAKQLKNVGYEFDLLQMSKRIISFKDEDGIVYAMPNLSELIEACGEEFWKLEVAENYLEGKGFLASTTIENPKFTNPDKEDAWCEFGKTPEEAVANLWLELNKK